jgi:glucose/arabinose dehydrogenase
MRILLPALRNLQLELHQYLSKMKSTILKPLRFALTLFAVLSLTAIFLYRRNPCISGQTQSQYSVDLAFPNLVFDQPVGIITPHDGTNRLFVIEQTGVIRVFENSPATSESTVFLDIRNKVLYGGEQGLLGLAFHANYTINGYFYVDYVAQNPLRTVIARYSVSPSNPDEALENSELILLEVNQPFSNHKGGQIAFGVDGYLYIGLGDGGSAGDPFGNAQNRSTLLGKILRINVDSASQGRNYSIAPDNPYFGNILGYKEEIFAYGFRNPWRFSFDVLTGRLWVGDVGQDKREEIDIVENGKNYGWNIMEGTLAFSGGSQTGLEPPVWEYTHDDGIAIIGGYVYRGSTLTGLYYKYIYGDFGSGKIWALQYDGFNSVENPLLVDTDLSISSFGVDEQNELYICSLGGEIYSLKTNSVVPSPSPTSSVNPTQYPSTTYTSTPIATSGPTATPTVSQSPLSSNTPQGTSGPQPQSSGNEFLIYVITAIFVSVIATTIALILRRRQRK